MGDILTRTDVLEHLTAARAEIIRLGARRLALFGSVQRNAARPDSDVDFLVEFAPGEKTYGHLFALGEFLEQLLGRRVELVTPEGLSPYIGPHILAEATDVIRAA